MPNQGLAAQLRPLAALVDPRRQKLYRYVVGRRAAVSRDQAAAAVGITRAMAAFHLDKLVMAGLLRAEYRRLSARSGRGAGRPSKLYRVSRRRFGIAIPPRQHELLALVLAQALAGSDEGASAQDVGRRYGRSLGAMARKRLPARPAVERLVGCVRSILDDVGFEPTAGHAGRVVAANCPFDPLSRRFPSVVCYTAVAAVEGVLDGVGVEELRVTRDERPGRCCIVLVPNSGTASVS